MDDRPILIAAPVRSGTTMLAWLLHLHGVWIGEALPTRDPSTNPEVGTENDEIRDYLETIDRGISANLRPAFIRMVKTDGRWLVKAVGCLTNWRALDRTFPEARWLLPHRPVKSVVDSRKRAGRGQAAAVVRYHHSLQADIRGATEHAMIVEANELCAGGPAGEAEARRVFHFCSVRFFPPIYHDWVQPERWHG